MAKKGEKSYDDCRRSGASSHEFDLEYGSQETNEKECRICHLGLDSNMRESDIAMVLGCSCKNDLAAVHKQCAETWFKIRGNYYLIASMGLQVLWSLGLACLDVYALTIKRDLHNPVLVSLFVVGDWVTAILSLAAACSSAGVAVLFARDVHFCQIYPLIACSRYGISVALAFVTWILIATSSAVMFWILASV